MYVYMYVCMYVCMYVRMYVCMYVCTYLCMDEWMDGCMYVCMYVMYVCIMYVLPDTHRHIRWCYGPSTYIPPHAIRSTIRSALTGVLPDIRRHGYGQSPSRMPRVHATSLPHATPTCRRNKPGQAICTML